MTDSNAAGQAELTQTTIGEAAPQYAGRVWLTPAEVARLLGVDAKTVTRWAKQGLVPYGLTPGGHRRYRPMDIEPWMQVSYAANGSRA